MIAVQQHLNFEEVPLQCTATDSKWLKVGGWTDWTILVHLEHLVVLKKSLLYTFQISNAKATGTSAAAATWTPRWLGAFRECSFRIGCQGSVNSTTPYFFVTWGRSKWNIRMLKLHRCRTPTQIGESLMLIRSQMASASMNSPINMSLCVGSNVIVQGWTWQHRELVKTTLEVSWCIFEDP